MVVIKNQMLWNKEQLMREVKVSIKKIHIQMCYGQQESILNYLEQKKF